MHILQTAAYGGLEGMSNAYSENMNSMEAAAYRFGGGISEKSTIGALANLGTNLPVFQEHPIRRRRIR